MPLTQKTLRPTTLLLPAAALILAACAGEPREPAPITYRTPVSPSPTARPEAQPSQAAPLAAPSPVPSGQADSRGVVYYDGYESIRARAGDSIDSMAARVGLTGSELAAYNGLSTQYTPREGDELVLPAKPGRYQGTVTASASPTVEAAAPGYEPSAPARPGAAAASGEVWSAERARAAIGEEPAQPKVEAAPLMPPEAKPAPEPEPKSETATAAASTQPTPAPAAAAQKSGPSGFVRPVDAEVSRPFSRAAGPDRNDGVDFATKAGDPVRAAGDGTVALISESLGGLGTIILIRHDNDYLTVYGRVADVTVAKGDRIKKGQVIAKVADLAPPQGPSLHYEVRRGAESIDPAPYL